MKLAIAPARGGAIWRKKCDPGQPENREAPDKGAFILKRKGGE